MKNIMMNRWLVVCMAGVMALAAATASADQTGTAKPDKESYAGMVTSIDPQLKTITVKGWWLLPARRFEVGQDCVYTIPGKTPATFNDLRAGQKIQVNYQDARGVLIVDGIEMQPMHFDGMVKRIDSSKHKLTLHRFALDKSFQIENDCPVVLRGGRVGKLVDVQPGNYVTVTYEKPDNEPTARLIAQTSQVFAGKLKAIDLNEGTVKAKTMFAMKTFRLGNNCVVVVNGKPDGQLADLKPNEKLIISYDTINGVNIANRIAPDETAENYSYNNETMSGHGPVPSY
jgi:predicted RNA-binding protein